MTTRLLPADAGFNISGNTNPHREKPVFHSGRFSWAWRQLRAWIGGLLLLTSVQVFAQNLLLNPSFETLNRVNWTFLTNGTFGVNDSAVAPPTTDGANGVVFQAAGAPSSFIFYQDVVLPAAGAVSFQVAMGCTLFLQPGTLAATDFCRVDITDLSAATLVLPTGGVDTLASTNTGVLRPIFSTDGVTTGSVAQADTPPVDLTALAGQTVRVRFMTSRSNGVMAQILVDNARLMHAPVAGTSVPTLSEWGLMILSGLMALGVLAVMRRRQI